MELDFALLATGAEVSENAQIHLVGGGFDGINLPILPATAPIALVARFMIVESDSTEGHTIRIDFIAPDGTLKTLLEDDPIPFKKAKPGRQSFAVAIAKVALKFNEIGKHEIQLFGDKKLVKVLDLTVAIADSQVGEEQ